MTTPLRIAINAQIKSWQPGGASTVLLGLIKAMGELNDSDEHYTIVTIPQNVALLQSIAGSNQTVIAKSSPSKPAWNTNQQFRRQLRRLRTLFGRIFAPPVWPEVPISDGFYEQLGCDLIHFMHPNFVVCSLPSIFQVYDLQHLHFPQYFVPEEIVLRENMYPKGCHIAQAVVTSSQWSKHDIIEKYNTPASKIHVIQNAPPTMTYSGEVTSSETLRSRYSLPHSFIFYPAAFLPHKNHVRLLEALARLRDNDGLQINLVCTGNNAFSFFATIEEKIRLLCLEDQVQCLGFIPQEDLRGLYQLCNFVVFPSLFEGAGYPPLEAFHNNKAVCSSSATSLPEMVGNAALIFDPYSIEAIATSIKRLSLDDKLRDDLQKRGKQRLQDFSWTQTAKTYRALYRKVAYRTLNEEDRYLLNLTQHSPSKTQ